MSRRLVAKLSRRSCCLKNLIHRPPDDLRDPLLNPAALALTVDDIVHRRMGHTQLPRNADLRIPLLSQETNNPISRHPSHLLKGLLLLLAKLGLSRIVSGLVTITSFLFSNIEDVPSYLPRINPVFWYTMTALGVLWFIGILVRNRKQAISSWIPEDSSVPSHPSHVPEEQHFINYNGILWKIWTPMLDPLESLHRMGMNPKPYDIPVVGGRPFCPLCRTELLEEKNFFRGYHFSCPQEECNFSHNTSKNSSELYDAVQKVVDRTIFNT